MFSNILFHEKRSQNYCKIQEMPGGAVNSVHGKAEVGV